MKAVTDWFGAGKKAAICACMIIIGIFLTIFGPSKGTLGFVEYMLYAIALTGFVNILFSKINHINISFLPFLLVNIVLGSVAVNLVQLSISDMGTATLIGLEAVLALVAWVVYALLMKEIAFFRRVVTAFFCTALNSLSLVVMLFVIAILRWN